MKNKKELLTIPKNEYKNLRVEHLDIMCDILQKYSKDYKQGLLADDEYFIKLQTIVPKLNWMIEEMSTNLD